MARGPGQRGRCARFRSSAFVAGGDDALRASDGTRGGARRRAGFRVRGEAPSPRRPAGTHRQRHDAEARVPRERRAHRARLPESRGGRVVGRRAARSRRRSPDESRGRASGASGRHGVVPRVARRRRRSRARARLRGGARAIRAFPRRPGRGRRRRGGDGGGSAIVARPRLRDLGPGDRLARLRRAARARRVHAGRERLPHDARASRRAAECHVPAPRPRPRRRDARRRVCGDGRGGRRFGAGVDARGRRACERSAGDRRERVPRARPRPRGAFRSARATRGRAARLLRRRDRRPRRRRVDAALRAVRPARGRRARGLPGRRRRARRGGRRGDVRVGALERRDVHARAHGRGHAGVVPAHLDLGAVRARRRGAARAEPVAGDDDAGVHGGPPRVPGVGGGRLGRDRERDGDRGGGGLRARRRPRARREPGHAGGVFRARLDEAHRRARRRRRGDWRRRRFGRGGADSLGRAVRPRGVRLRAGFRGGAVRGAPLRRGVAGDARVLRRGERREDVRVRGVLHRARVRRGVLGARRVREAGHGRGRARRGDGHRGGGHPDR